MEVIGITALNRYVKTLLERDAVLTDVALRGEISNFVCHFKTGHFYFSLKDEQCSVKAVMFRSNAQRVPFTPQNGMRVIVRGRISLYERDGAFQVYAEDLFPDGVGAMQLAFEQLKARLSAEGLFAEEHKRPLPEIPQCVGLVTSKTGAALQDILQVTRRRFPMAHLLLCPVSVQGIEAAPGIAQAIRTLGESGKVDVVIVARGGGSQEDLWVFNQEQIARAAYACPVPVVSAVGHEIDFSILDFAADVRAPTPSAAAELVFPDASMLYCKIFTKYANICKQMQNRMDLCYNRLYEKRQAPALQAVAALPQRQRLRLEQLAARLEASMRERMGREKDLLLHRARLADSLSPLRVLARGYSIVHCGKSVIKRSEQVREGDAVRVKLSYGALDCLVLKSEKEGEDGCQKADL